MEQRSFPASTKNLVSSNKAKKAAFRWERGRAQRDTPFQGKAWQGLRKAEHGAEVLKKKKPLDLSGTKLKNNSRRLPPKGFKSVWSNIGTCANNKMPYRSPLQTLPMESPSLLMWIKKKKDLLIYWPKSYLPHFLHFFFISTCNTVRNTREEESDTDEGKAEAATEGEIQGVNC